MAQCRKEYHDLLMAGNISCSHVSASNILQTFVRYQAGETIQAVGGELDNSKGAFTNTSLETSIPSKRSAPDVVSEVEEVDVSDPNRKIRGLDASPGRSLTLEDLSPRHRELSVEDVGDYLSDATPSVYSPRELLGPDLPSTDPADSNFVDHEDLLHSTSKLYFWNYLDGPGRMDSVVSQKWVYNGIDVSDDLMAFRNRVIENNGAIAEPFEKLAVNFIFLLQAPYHTGGVQGEIEDQTWHTLCKAVRDPVPSLANEVVMEAHQWAHQLANNDMKTFARVLEESPPQDRTLKTVLTRIAGTSQFWNTQTRNEDTYLKFLLGPFLDSYFGILDYTKSDWTPTQEDTKGPASSLLVPDYGTTTQVGKRQYFILLLEGKIAGNAGFGQMWDDLTKLGQELKRALDSILQLLPEGDVCVVGILVREPFVEFYTMRITAEGIYIMHRFASAIIAPDAMNAFPLIRLMEIFDHVKGKIEQTVAEIRRVKVRPSETPKVPLSWCRPSFKKPRRYSIVDGQ